MKTEVRCESQLTGDIYMESYQIMVPLWVPIIIRHLLIII